MDLEITGQRTSNTHLHDAHNFTSHITRNTYPLTKLNTRTAYPLEIRKKKKTEIETGREKSAFLCSFLQTPSLLFLSKTSNSKPSTSKPPSSTPTSHPKPSPSVRSSTTASLAHPHRIALPNPCSFVRS